MVVLNDNGRIETIDGTVALGHVIILGLAYSARSVRTSGIVEPT